MEGTWLNLLNNLIIRILLHRNNKISAKINVLDFGLEL